MAEAGVTVWYNPRCSKCRGAEELLAAHGIPAQRLLYLDTPPPAAEIRRVLGLLGAGDPRELMRTTEPRYAELGLAEASADELVGAMARHPELIQRPVVIWADRAVIARPPELLLALLEGPGGTPVIALRPVQDADLDALFDQMRDPEAVLMAAFTAADPDDRHAFDAHMAKVRSAPDTTLLAITRDGQLVGSVGSFIADGQTEVTYWIDRPAWGRGIASRALELLLDLVPDRPLHARAASDNVASLRVLQKAGFEVIGTENSYAPGRHQRIEETILRLR